MVSARVAAKAVNELTLKPDQSDRADQIAAFPFPTLQLSLGPHEYALRH